MEKIRQGWEILLRLQRWKNEKEKESFRVVIMIIFDNVLYDVFKVFIREETAREEYLSPNRLLEKFICDLSEKKVDARFVRHEKDCERSA